jgi:hypothetical protein
VIKELDLLRHREEPNDGEAYAVRGSKPRRAIAEFHRFTAGFPQNDAGHRGGLGSSFTDESQKLSFADAAGFEQPLSQSDHFVPVLLQQNAGAIVSFVA